MPLLIIHTLFHTLIGMAAVLLLAISYIFERHAYQEILPDLAPGGIALAVLVALAFNASKVIVAFVHGYSNRMRLGSALGRLFSVPKLLLILMAGLSFLSAFLLVSTQLDSPFAKAEMEKAERETRADYRDRAVALEQARGAELAQLSARYDRQRRALRNLHQPIIDTLRKDLKQEMDNVVNGDFKGPRYAEIEARLKRKEGDLAAALAALSPKESSEAAALEERFNERRQALQQERQQQLAAIDLEHFENSAEAAHPMVRSLLNTINPISDWGLEPNHIALLFTLLVSLIVELTPLFFADFLAKRLGMAELAARGRDEVHERQAIPMPQQPQSRRPAASPEAPDAQGPDMVPQAA